MKKYTKEEKKLVKYVFKQWKIWNDWKKKTGHKKGNIVCNNCK